MANWSKMRRDCK